MSTIYRFRFIVLILIIAAAILSACQSTDGPQMSIGKIWGRPSPKMAMTGAVYAVLENTGNEADRLIGVSSTAAKTVEIHETVMEGDVMNMRPLDGGLEIPAGSAVELKPGGYHIMLIDLVEPLESGSNITVTFQFEKSGEIVLNAEIREQ